MKRTSLSIVLTAVLGLVLLSACGGGGGGGNSAPQTTLAVVTLSTAATSSIPAGTTINSYDVTIPLPAGVTVKTMLNSSETSTGVVTASGKAAGAIISGVYTAATGSVSGSVKVYVWDASGFDPGEFCTVNVDIAAGASLSSVAPTLDEATGFNGVSTVLGLEGQLSVSAQVTIF